LDFEVNALGSVNLLEATRQHSPEAVFVFMSTNKVYGEAPNEDFAEGDGEAIRLREGGRFCWD